MKYIKEYNRLKNTPKKVVTDNLGYSIFKMSQFKDNHTVAGFSDSQIRIIEDLLNKKKSKLSYEWVSQGSHPKLEVYLKLTYKEWTKHNIKQFEDGYCTYITFITAYEDDWFAISNINKDYGYTSFYIADQMDELLNYLDEI